MQSALILSLLRVSLLLWSLVGMPNLPLIHWGIVTYAGRLRTTAVLIGL